MNTQTTAPSADHKPQYERASVAAKYFKIGRSTLWQWTKRPGWPPCLRAGPKVTLFDIAAIEAYLKAQAEQVNP